MRTVKLTKETKENLLNDLLKRSPNNYTEYADTVQAIVDDVRENKDQALFAYTEKFDHAKITGSNVKVTKEEMKAAYNEVDPHLVEVIRKALVNIRTYHEKQKQYSWFDSGENGTMLGQKVTPLHSVGVYVPGGKAVYPSSVLMNIVPAKVAGVPNIIMTTPCNAEGKVYPTTLVAANEAGVDAIYKAGGAQAIAEPETISPDCVLTNTALILMPGLLFDTQRHRLGYGGGYYDKYLSAHTEHRTAALCYDFQVIDHTLPYEEHDRLPDYLVTEHHIYE